jgi:hypothetical protein
MIYEGGKSRASRPEQHQPQTMNSSVPFPERPAFLHVRGFELTIGKS